MATMEMAREQPSASQRFDEVAPAIALPSSSSEVMATSNDASTKGNALRELLPHLPDAPIHEPSSASLPSSSDAVDSKLSTSSSGESSQSRISPAQMSTTVSSRPKSSTSGLPAAGVVSSNMARATGSGVEAGEESEEMEEMEEVLEELQDYDDENGDTDGAFTYQGGGARSAWRADSGVVGTTGQELRLVETVLATERASVAALQTVIRSIASDPRALPLMAGHAKIEKLEAALASTAQNLSTSSVLPSPFIDDPRREATTTINQLLDSFTLDAAQGNAALIDDMNLVNALGSLLSRLEASKDAFNGSLAATSSDRGSASQPSSSPQIPSGSMPQPQQPGHVHKHSGQYQLHRAPSSNATWLAQSSPSVQASRGGFTSTSPSASRESLRDPFAETQGFAPSASSSSACMVEDGSKAFVRLLDSLAVQTSSFSEGASLRPGRQGIEGSNGMKEEVKPSLPATSEVILLEDDQESESKGQKIQDQDTESAMIQLQKVASIARELVVSRSASLPPLLSLEQSQAFAGLLPSRTSSPAPVSRANMSYSPSLSPTRGRSRRSSLASRSSSGPVSPSAEALIGDPAGEAIVAGVGVGVGAIGPTSRRSLSRSSSNSNLHITTSPGAGGSTTAMTATLSSGIAPPGARRASTTSERGAYIPAMQSPPPRYSEDSLRSWSSAALGHASVIPLSSSLAGVPSFDTAQKDGSVSRRSSGDVSFGTTHFLPAYARGSDHEAAYRYSSDGLKGRSSSSLSHYDTKSGINGLGARATYHSTETAARDGEKERAKSANATQEYLARTSQDLTLVENGIARLYSALPQLSDQRATPSASPRSHSFARAEDEKPGAVFDAIERLSRGGRMEDQRAPPPPVIASGSSSFYRHDLLIPSPVEPASPGSGGARGLVRRFSSVAPLALGSLTLRGRSGTFEGKGKRRDLGPEVNGSNTTVPVISPRSTASTDRHVTNGHARFDGIVNHRDYQEDADLDIVASRVLSARDREYADQRVEFRARPRQMGRASKLEKMGINVRISGSEDDLFEKLSSASRRLEGQDAVMLPKKTRRSIDVLNQTHARSMSSQEGLPTKSNGDMHSQHRKRQSIHDPSNVDQRPTSQATGIPARLASSAEPSAGDRVDDEEESDDELVYVGQPTSKWVTWSVLSVSPHELATHGDASSYRPGSVEAQAKRAKESDEPAKERLADTKDFKSEGNPLRCVCETQARLGTMTVSLWYELREEQLKQKRVDMRWHFYVNEIGENIEMTTVTNEGQQEKICFPLPSKGVLSQGAMQYDKDHWNAKVSVSQTASVREDERPQADLSEPPLSASSLQRNGPTRLHCTSCLEPMVDLQSISRYVALPSQHWEELIDAWMCHGDQEINVGLVQAHKDMDDSKAVQVGEVRVSDSHLTLNGADVIEGTVKMLQSSSPESQPVNTQYSSWLACSRCNFPLGQVITPLTTSAPPALRKGHGSIRIGKYAIRPVPSSSPTKPAPSILPLIIANDLLRLTQAHAARHFIIESVSLAEGDRATGSNIKVTIWLFLESFNITVSKTAATALAFHGLKNDEHLLNACKVMYRMDSTDTSNDSGTNNRGSWSQPGMVERLAFPHAWCRCLVQALEHSTGCLAPSQRNFGPWRVGFLERTDGSRH